MKITKIYVTNFKSLVDFEIELSTFNCLIGLNGAGKSTFLQFVSFLSQLMRGHLDEWLKRRQWKLKDVHSACFRQNGVHAIVDKPTRFRVSFQDDHGEKCFWESDFNPSSGRCFNEKFSLGNHLFQTRKSKSSSQRFYLLSSRDKDNRHRDINFQYEGSIFSVLDDKKIPEEFYRFRDLICEMESVDLLAPQYLRNRARVSSGSIGQGGEYLSALLSELNEDTLNFLNGQLRSAYPHLVGFDAKTLRSGWKQLEITETYNQQKMTTESRHVNDGLLRLLAILAQLQTHYRFLLFDEIENGINPELIGFLLSTLIESKKQTIVTTHSPMILNFLDDETAIKGVHLIYKTSDGHSQCVRFLAIPSMAEKLEVMGPGEVFIDTNLVALSEELENESKPQEKEN